MTIRYEIHPDLDFLLYIFQGHFTAADYFSAYEKVYEDSRRHHGMKILADLYKGQPEMDTADFWKAVDLMRKNREEGHVPDHLAILTTADSMHYFTSTLKLLADEMPVHMHVFHNFQDAVNWLGLGDHMEEVKQFWQEFKRENMAE